MRKFWLGFYLYPPETGSGSGSPENIATPGTDASVSSGTASEALIAAAMASESSSGGTGTESEAAKVAKATGLNTETGDTTKPDANAGVAKPDATGRPESVETGQAPQSRIESAVKNARAAVTAEYEGKYGWAKNLDKETVQTAFGLASALLQDTPKFLRTLAAQEGFQLTPIGEKPEVPAAETRKPFSLPKAELRSEDGKGAFSEDQVGQILKDFAADMEEKFGTQLKPILSDREAAEKSRREEAIVSEARATVTETMTELRARPFFQVTNAKGEKVDSPKIMEYLMEIPAKVRQANPVAAIHRAYAVYMEKDILPNYGRISEQNVRDENARKAAAGGSVRPGAGGGHGETVAKPLRGVNDLAADMERRFAAASSGA